MNIIVNPNPRLFIYLTLGLFLVHMGSCSPNDEATTDSKSSLGSDIISQDYGPDECDTKTKETATSSRDDSNKAISESSLVRMLSTADLSGAALLEMAEHLEISQKYSLASEWYEMAIALDPRLNTPKVILRMDELVQAEILQHRENGLADDIETTVKHPILLHILSIRKIILCYLLNKPTIEAALCYLNNEMKDAVNTELLRCTALDMDQLQTVLANRPSEFSWVKSYGTGSFIPYPKKYDSGDSVVPEDSGSNRLEVSLNKRMDELRKIRYNELFDPKHDEFCAAWWENARPVEKLNFLICRYAELTDGLAVLEIIRHPCLNCNGTGFIKKVKYIDHTSSDNVFANISKDNKKVKRVTTSYCDHCMTSCTIVSLRVR